MEDDNELFLEHLSTLDEFGAPRINDVLQEDKHIEYLKRKLEQ